ncbi:MAG: ATP-binding domain-containing protein, partial [Actinomycetota bacterium]|nr:ATP-binding domain-containing protein [Actinomycetota bacterium]
VDFCGIPLRHPIVNASGTFDAIAAHRAFGDALLARFPFAAFVSKTVTLEPRQGNPPPRLWELAGGMINSIGLPNKGLAGYLARDLPELARLPVPLIVNVMGFTREQVAALVETVGSREEVGALELNVSCPNVKTGLVMGADPSETAALLDAVRPCTDKPLIVKLTPNTSSAAAVAAAAEEEHEAVGDGKVAVIAPTSLVDELRPDLPPVPEGEGVLDVPVALLAVDEAKGLEFDSVVLVEPAAIIAEGVGATGRRALYVAMTRTTRRLHIVHADPLPPELLGSDVRMAG